MNQINKTKNIKVLIKNLHRLSVALSIFFFFVITTEYLYSQSIFCFKWEGGSVLLGDAHNASLGYAEIPGTFSSNIRGSIAFMKLTGIEITYCGTRLEMKDNNGKNIMHYYGIPNIKGALTLPMDFVFGFNLQKSRDFNANFITSPDSINSVSYIERFKKKGQLSIGNIEIAKKIGSISSVGFGIDILFGGSNEIWITDFTSTLYNDTKDSLNSNYFGYSYSLGAVFNMQPFRFTLGYSLPLSCEKAIESYSYLRKDTIISKDELTFPSFYTFGSLFSLEDKFNILFTVRYRDWTNFESNGEENNEFLDVLSYSIGFEYIGIKGYKKRPFPLRFGVFSEPWYFKDSYNKKITDNGITIGTSIPFLQNDKFVDVAFVMGKRETEELKERFYNLYLGFNFYERW